MHIIASKPLKKLLKASACALAPALWLALGTAAHAADTTAVDTIAAGASAADTTASAAAAAPAAGAPDGQSTSQQAGALANPKVKTSNDNSTTVDEVIVTATKQVGGARVQDVPIAITALGKTQLENMQLRTLATLNDTIPNTQIGSGASLPGTANFAMRGLGTQSGVASVEPTVGLFYGAIFDTFDVEGVEALRGPQGVLFGKNVTGGAVVLNTTTPKNDWYLDAGASIETDPNYTVDAVLSGPIIKDVLDFKIAGYYNKDDGFFTDKAQGGKLGGGTNDIVRAALKWMPTSDLTVIARYEHSESNYDTDPPQQNAVLYGGTFDVATSGLGFEHSHTDDATLQADWNVPFGHGVVTDVLGYRKVWADGSFDVDATPLDLYQAHQSANQNQTSNELRYAGKFGSVDVLGGVYYFQQYMQELEQRDLGVGNGGVAFNTFLKGGGRLDQHTYGVFANVDWHITDNLTFTVGGRETSETKRALVATLEPNNCNPATLSTKLVCNYDFSGQHTFNGFTPKVGLQWKADANTMVYATYSQGLRAGGYSFRNTKLGLPPGPYADEINNSEEIGIKTDLADGRLRINADVYHQTIKNVQRDRIFQDPVFGAGTITGNVGDAVYQGVEVETTYKLTHEITLTGFLGTIDAHWTKLTADLNGDGVINQNDLNLKIVRAPPLSWGAGATWDHPMETGRILARVNYGFTDKQAYLDNNESFLPAIYDLSASIAWRTMDDHTTFTLYGKNLLNEQYYTSSVVLPTTFAGDGISKGYNTLAKGRVIGFSVRYKM
jgi:iron complex outermembrane receptor protein